jgi:hypothetical protein
MGPIASRYAACGWPDGTADAPRRSRVSDAGYYLSAGSTLSLQAGKMMASAASVQSAERKRVKAYARIGESDNC